MTSHRSPAITHDGHSLNDWDETISDLDRHMLRIDADGPSAMQPIFARWERLREGLAHLQDYYTRLPAETACFSDDEVFLEQVAQATQRRILLIDDLLAALERD